MAEDLAAPVPDTIGRRVGLYVRCVLLSVFAAVGYGVVHDMITAHVCLEYFTVFHPRLLAPSLEHPIPIALAWGVVATWWVGLPLGVLLGLGAVVGRRPAIETRRLVIILVAFSATLLVLSTILGMVGFVSSEGMRANPDLIAEGLPAQKVARFWYAAFSHGASYCLGVLLGLLLPFIAYFNRPKAVPERGPA